MSDSGKLDPRDIGSLVLRAMDFAHDAIIVRELETGAVNYWNREASEIYGYSAEGARGRITHELLATEFPESRKAVEDALRTRGRWEGELRQVRADGRRIVVSSRQALLPNDRGEPLAVIELNYDVTRRRSAESALRAAEERVRGLVDTTPDAMVVVAEDGAIVLVNTQAEELFGYRHRELVGQPVEVLLPEGLTGAHVTHRQGFIAEPRTRPMGAGMELLARRKDGTEFPAQISLSPVRTQSGLLVSAAVRDVGKLLLRQFERALVPRIRVGDHWQLAWLYRPTTNTMLLGGDFIGIAERPDGWLSLLIGDVTGHGPAAAGTGAMLRSAWLGAVLSDVPMRSLAALLHRLLINQSDRAASTLATACLAEVDPQASELRLIRAGHPCPLLITAGGSNPVEGPHGPALGLSERREWPLQQVPLSEEAALMLFTDGLTERRPTPHGARVGFDHRYPGVDPHQVLHLPPQEAIEKMVAGLFPSGTEHLDDDLAVILLNLSRSSRRRVDSPSGTEIEGAIVLSPAADR